MSVDAYQLIRISVQNGHFARLEEQWKSQRKSLGFEEEDNDYVPMMMMHARKIASESPQDPRYGIYALVNDKDGECQYEGLVHVNHKLPRTSDSTVRMVWNILAPKYDALDREHIAKVISSYLFRGIGLCHSEMPAGTLQVYIQNATDRAYVSNIAKLFGEFENSEFDNKVTLTVKGLWLFVEGIRPDVA